MGSNSRSGWPKAVAIAAIIAYVVWAGASIYTFTHLPPIPNEIVTTNGKVLFTKEQIIQGKYLFQKYGLMDYGSVLGFGGYFGIDFTSYTITLWEKYIASTLGIDPFIPGDANETQLILPYLKVTYNRTDNVMIVNPILYNATQYAINYYANYLGPESEENRFLPHYITNTTVITDLTAYWTWTALIALLGYTHGYPYIPGITRPTSNIYFASDLMIYAFMIGVFAVGSYIVLTLIRYWNDPVTPIQLPMPNDVQRIALWGIPIVVIGAAIQGLLGTYLMHLYASPTLYGLNLLNILPFNAARALHYTLAILWIADTWVIFSLFALPYLGVQLSRRQTLGIMAGAIIVSIATLLGIWLNYLQIIPYSGGTVQLWFMFGGQGRDVVTQGTIYLLLLAALLFYLAYLFYRAPPSPLQSLSRVLGISIAGNAFGIVLGALPVIHPWTNFTVDEYFRWITIHAFVESFWPAIIVSIIAILLVIAGLAPVRLATAIVGFDAILDIATGLIGTGHHYYWGGQPVIWLYIGSIVSILEVITLGFAIIYALLLWWRGGVKTEFQKTLLYVTVLAGVGGGIGAAAFGGGVLNAPILNYYLHDSQATMAHAHVAFPLAFGLPTILLWVVMLYLTGAVRDSYLRFVRIGATLYTVGFYLQALITLLPLGFLQYMYELKYGFWYIKSLEPLFPGLTPFWQLPLAQDLIWLRMIGDLTAAAGFAIIGLLVLFAFMRWVSTRKAIVQVIT
ncbi:cbb3-type cytochrome c oxidase subunit I [Vulcanisaeta sp. JCM 14467]